MQHKALGECNRLIVKKQVVTMLLTTGMFIGYFGFILLLAYNKMYLAQKIGVHLTLGIPIGLGVIGLAWLLTGVYVLWANQVYDKTAEAIKVRWSEEMNEQAAAGMGLRREA